MSIDFKQSKASLILDAQLEQLPRRGLFVVNGSHVIMWRSLSPLVEGRMASDSGERRLGDDG